MLVTLAEINKAREEFIQAQEALDWADEDFIETAIYQHKTAEARYNALLKRAKSSKDKIVQFPIVENYPNREERAMDYVGMGVLRVTVLLGVMLVVFNLGRAFGLWG